MTYPFAGEIKMTKVIKDGKEVIEWEPVNTTYHAEPTPEWARIDKDLNVTHLDMELCRKGPQNEYTALALAIWDAAKKDWQGLTREECLDAVDGLEDLEDCWRAIEDKLRQKNQ